MARVPAKNATQGREAMVSIPFTEKPTQPGAEYRGGDFAQDVDERGRKGITLERRIKRFWAGRGSVRRDLARAIARAKQRPRRAAFYRMGR